ncbi:DUF427 domain-containing protein [Gordonia amicalis]|uniref:DUF427 domain-containing protein n=1 Tax=Gordonia amicalis TaxID=89053 RepID=UPI0029558B16|nr:DUF427 domain-containing protein [Gordonia amicalis]MDV7099300.1 DUF427 domain-containing protein [Gordonia amicalis]
MATSLDEVTKSQVGLLRWTDMHRRVRAFVDGQVVVDSAEPIQVWEPYRVVGSYAVRTADIAAPLEHHVPTMPGSDHPAILTPAHPFSMHTAPGATYDIGADARTLVGAGFRLDDPDLADYVLLDWDAFDEWREEEQIAMGHAHDPYKRIDCLATSRHIVVRIGDTVLAESHNPTLLLETHLPARHYIPREDVRMDVLQRSDTVTVCAYKGQAKYWSAVVGDEVVPDVAWTYTDPLPDAEPVRDLICFYDEWVDVQID